MKKLKIKNQNVKLQIKFQSFDLLAAPLIFAF